MSLSVLIFLNNGKTLSLYAKLQTIGPPKYLGLTSR